MKSGRPHPPLCETQEMTAHSVHISVFPLGSSEPLRALDAIRTAWLAPAWVSKRTIDGAWLLEVAMEAPLPEGDDAAAFTERMSVAIWRRVGRYVKVVVDVAQDESDTSHRREFGRPDYLKLMKAT